MKRRILSLDNIYLTLIILIMKRKYSFEDLMDDYWVLIYIFVLLPIWISSFYWIVHIIEYKGHHPLFCWNRYLDIFWYLVILILVWLAIGYTIEFFQENGFKWWIRKILISLFYLIGLVILASIFTWNWDWDDWWREPRYDNCSKC